MTKHISNVNENRNMMLMTLVRTAGKIFLIGCGLSFIAFSIVFMVGFPLYLEHSLISSRFSVSYVVNFFYGMSLYFLLNGVLCVLVYLYVKSFGNEVRLFIISFIAMFWGFLGSLATESAFWGNSVHPFWMSIFWQNWWWPPALGILSLYLLVISALIVIVYRISAFVWSKMTGRRKAKQEC